MAKNTINAEELLRLLENRRMELKDRAREGDEIRQAVLCEHYMIAATIKEMAGGKKKKVTRLDLFRRGTKAQIADELCDLIKEAVNGVPGRTRCRACDVCPVGETCGEPSGGLMAWLDEGIDAELPEAKE